METSDEVIVKALLQEFVQESVPEYILDGAKAILAEGGMQKLSLKKDTNYWEVEGGTQDEDLQIYSPKLSLQLTDKHTSYHCNCNNAFSGVCTHVGATVLKLLASLESSHEGTEPVLANKGEWKQSFRSYFSTEFEPEAGKHYIVYRFYTEPGRLQVAFFRARQNKTGLSTVHTEVSIEQIIASPEWCELSSQLPKVLQLVGEHLDYFGHRVVIPEGLLSWFLWSIKDEYYLLWEDSDIPCHIQSRAMNLRLHPLLDAAWNLSFDLVLHAGEGKLPMSITASKATFHGQMPLWVCWNKGFYPVHSSLPTALVQELAVASPIIPKEEISEFLDRVWTSFPVSDLYEQESFLESMEPAFIIADYSPKLFLGEEGSLLTLQVQNVYHTTHGEFILAGPNPEMLTGSYSFEGSTFLIRRNQEAEANLVNMLVSMKFQPRSVRTWFLEPEEAINFLLDVYPQLVAEYRVFGEKSLTRYKVHHAQPVIVADVTSNEEEKWFSLDIAVTYEGQSVPLEKIWKAWTQGKRYVQLKDGSYTSLPTTWLEKLAHKLEALGIDSSQPPKEKFQQFEAPMLDTLLEDLPSVTTDSFWNTLRDKLHTFEEISPVAVPKGLNATLRGYQLQGVSYLNFLREYGFGGILADEMGLGKTVQTLTFLQHMIEKGQTGPNLIVVPTSVLPNWDREAAKFVPSMRRLLIQGTRREELFKQIEDSDLVITTYALLRRDLDALTKFQFNSIILDEAQNIKNPNTITARSVRRINAKLRLCLSGTPIENNLFELWSLFEFLMPGFLGAQHAFQRGVVKPIKDGDLETLEYLRTRVRPFILRRTKAEVAKDLPPKIENITYCALADEQAELYAMLAKKLREQILTDVDQKGLGKSQMSILDALLKLRQICCHPRLLRLDMPGVSNNLPSGKFDAFKDMIVDIVEEGHKVLVFSQFVQMLHIIRSWLTISNIPFAYLDGTSKDRIEQVDTFNNSPHIPIFLISLKAGGTGLNLTSADYVIHYDPWWNPAVENQATDRTHRIGQTRQVFSYKLICQDTVEEKIIKLQDQKRGVAESIIPGQEVLKSLTRDDLEMLFEI